MEGIDVMTEFKLGDRVKVTVESPPRWAGAFTIPVGSVGTVHSIHVHSSSYGILVDDDPDQMPASFSVSELELES